MVPAKTWKVALVLPAGRTDPKEVTANDVTIAAIMPNSQDIDLDWTKYICTVTDVEVLTGFKFFTEVDPAVAKQIKSQKYVLTK